MTPPLMTTYIVLPYEMYVQQQKRHKFTDTLHFHCLYLLKRSDNIISTPPLNNSRMETQRADIIILVRRLDRDIVL